jgi:hypothetical protein
MGILDQNRRAAGTRGPHSASFVGCEARLFVPFRRFGHCASAGLMQRLEADRKCRDE